MNAVVAELVQRIQEGENELITELWEKFRPLWTKWARNTQICGYEVEDLEQESYLILVDVLERFKQEIGVPFEGYYPLVLRRWRAAKIRRKSDYVLFQDDAEEEKVSEELGVEEVAVNQTLVKEACSYLSVLPDIEQYVIKGFYFEGKSIKELARTLEVSYKTVENKKARILDKLRQKII